MLTAKKRETKQISIKCYSMMSATMCTNKKQQNSSQNISDILQYAVYAVRSARKPIS